MKQLFVVVLLLLVGAQTTHASYAVVNAENAGLLLGDNAHEPLPIASLTKIWTAYIVLTNSSLDEQVEISKEAAHMEGSSIYLQQGQKKTVEHLLYGLLLRSGNDAATALAEHVGGSVEGFVQLMNEAAQRHGLQNTTFRNPSGLHHDEHLISAYDIAQMLNIAMENPDFRKIASSTYFTDGEVHWFNKHRLIGTNEAFAGKTGYTKVAGRTLATYYKQKDRAFTVVTINVPDDWRVHEAFAEEVQKDFKNKTLIKKGRYRVGGKTIVVKQPMTALVKNNKNLQHYIRYSRLRQDEAIWHITQDGQTILARRVQIE